MRNFLMLVLTVFSISVHAQEVTPTELETSVPTVLRITVVDWTSGISKTHLGCNSGYMTQLSSANTTYLFATCTLAPVFNKMPTYSEQNQFSTTFVEIGINNPGLNELEELHGCFRTSETTVVQGNSPFQYNIRSITIECPATKK